MDSKEILIFFGIFIHLDLVCCDIVTQMRPSYGPKSGGTYVELLGSFGDDPYQIQFGDTQCVIHEELSNQTRIICLTSELRETNKIDRPQLLKITSCPNNNCGNPLIQSNFDFTYKLDPIIFSASPNKTFLRGGLMQTITGQHFDSVYPTFFIAMIWFINRIVQPYSIKTCTIHNSTLMTCPSPTIHVPSHFHTSWLQSNCKTSKRKKRQSRVFYLNNNNIQFFISFGIYNTFTAQLNFTSDQHTFPIPVYKNPDLCPFNDDKYAHPKYKDGGTRLTLTGHYVNYAASKDDYTVKIGDCHNCTVIEIGNTTLDCMLPQEEPGPCSNDEIRKGGHPRVVVSVGYLNRNLGYIQYYDTRWEEPSFQAMIGGIIGAGVFLILLLVIGVYWYRRNQEFKRLKKERLIVPPNIYGEKTILERISEDIKEGIQKCSISSSLIEQENQIGKGNFGLVFKGYYTTPENVRTVVAIKTLKEVSLESTESFLKEAILMHQLGHQNVLPLIGVTLDSNEVQIILPYMENGSLKDYITNGANELSVYQLLQMSQDACKGLAYMESQKILHRDVATRNCMVDSNKIVKVADFGLARDIYEKDYYKQSSRSPLPLAWMAIECLRGYSSYFTSKSDVWSFGVLLWEMMTRGRRPYADINVQTYLKIFLDRGGRLEKPPRCPSPVYDLMLKCWQEKAEDRPSFFEIEAILSRLLDPNGPPTEDGNYISIYDKPEFRERMSVYGGTHHVTDFDYSQAYDHDPGQYLQLVGVTPDDYSTTEPGHEHGRSQHDNMGYVINTGDGHPLPPNNDQYTKMQTNKQNGDLGPPMYGTANMA